MSYEFTPSNKVCSKKISFDIKDNKIYNLKFVGGCPGNLLAISKLLEGQDIDKTIEILQGNQCGIRGTSCADQLSIALKKYKEDNS
jgi:uncharacterized protein (TIGR03905 family)